MALVPPIKLLLRGITYPLHNDNNANSKKKTNLCMTEPQKVKKIGLPLYADVQTQLAQKTKIKVINKYKFVFFHADI